MFDALSVWPAGAAWPAWPAVAAIFVAVGTGWCLVKLVGAPAESGRYVPIDGLRGYLAFFVFVHHVAVWSTYLRTGQWTVPADHLYAHFGQSSVALFFMITGFLFFSKLLDARRGRPIDWLRLYVSRLLRLAPLYFALVGAMFVVVGVLSGWQLHGSWGELLKGVARWLGFMIRGGPDLNGIEHTGRIGAGVAWSLAYEWFFYLGLPLLALAVGLRAPWPWLLLSLLAMVYAVAVFQPEAMRVLSFLGGLAAALLVRSPHFVRLAQGRAASALIIACLAAVVAFFPEAYAWPPLALLAVAFALIAGGNSLFGALTHAASRTLGELAYSIYLMHALLLFLLIRFVAGIERASAWPAQTHALLMLAVTPLLLGLCVATFRMIEQPAMRRVDACTAGLRARLRLPRARRVAPGEIA